MLLEYVARGAVQFRINSMGVRSDQDYTFEEPAGTIRIVGLGDLFMQGYEVDVRDTDLHRPQENLRAKGYPVEVINLGVSGHGTAEELLMLRHFGVRFDPDVVIVGYFQNDLDDNIRSNLYRLNDQGQLLRAAASYLPAIGARNKLYSFRIYRWLAENSRLLSLVREAVAKIVKRKMVEEHGVAPEPGAKARIEDANVPEKGGDATYSARLAARLLDEL
ncbi:MAG: hypothetical protein JSV19_01345 [Phycisphaerales bacterium]|nr:MAG: hypothetical protein JSV19_01345 [Phycisphaerales bacterium]